MKIIPHEDGNILIIELKGDLNHDSGVNLIKEIKNQLEHKHNNILLDLSRLAHIDDAGFEALGSVLYTVKKKNALIVIMSTNEEITKIIVESKYNDFLKIFDDKEKAMHELNRPHKKK